MYLSLPLPPPSVSPAFPQHPEVCVCARVCDVCVHVCCIHVRCVRMCMWVCLCVAPHISEPNSTSMPFLLCVCMSICLSAVDSVCLQSCLSSLSPAAFVRAALSRLPEETPHSPLPKFTALSNGANLLWEEKASFKLGYGGSRGGRGGLLGCSLKTPRPIIPLLF